MMGELASTSSSLFVSTCSGSDIESHFTTDTGSTSTQVKQFLARLQALRRSELTQKRQIRRNCGLIVKKKNPSCSTDPSSVTPLQHFTTDTGSTSTQVKQFLARLQALRRSELTQKRQICRNCGLIVKKKNPSCSTDPSSVTPLQQVQKFPGEALSVSAGKLFCTAHRKKLSLTKHCYDAHKGDQALSWEKRS